MEGLVVSQSVTAHKRPAEDSLESEQRLTKRFNLLNLERNGKLFIPVQPIQTPSPEPLQRARKRSNAFSDTMQLDDTRDKVYIYNLDDEVSDIESEEEKLVFLPDIEKKLSKIPQSVLMSKSEPHTSNQVVLYQVPESLTVPPEHDIVRKAIIEARARALEKAREVATTNMLEPLTNGFHTTPKGEDMSLPMATDDDLDAMEIE